MNAAASVRAAIDDTNSPSEKTLMRELYIDLQEWERLSTTFRFRSGSSTLDNASQRDLLTLAGHLSENGAGLEIALVGFTDSDGPSDANTALGLKRASTVREKLRTIAGGSGIDISGIGLKSYGELNPVACNTDYVGQRLNRRVEVWVRKGGGLSAQR